MQASNQPDQIAYPSKKLLPPGINLKPEINKMDDDRQLLRFWESEITFWQQESEKIHCLVVRCSSGKGKSRLDDLGSELKKFVVEDLAEALKKLQMLKVAIVEKERGAEPTQLQTNMLLMQTRKRIKKMETHYRYLKIAILEELYNVFPLTIY